MNADDEVKHVVMANNSSKANALWHFEELPMIK